jgi:hypothetical protein
MTVALFPQLSDYGGLRVPARWLKQGIELVFAGKKSAGSSSWPRRSESGVLA